MIDASAPEATDVFSLSDHLLAERLHFVKEIGFGNWGSVWLCQPKSKSSSEKLKDVEVAVKLVHRSKTSTTAARVRSLWNEMKIVRSFKADPHPSIIPFHSFIITPSYALITMAYLPTLVPVEVSEPRAKEWFRSLLSGVNFLHERGVVHNDIKPANILLTRESVPVLVDFGFAEKYDLSSPKAFHSNLTYGTPEYLSPERARGLPHDTRKSDIWALGITFFEILVGRTPFEYEEGEQFATKADLEKYWGRTMRGKWVGTYSIPRPAEKFLKRMIVPNADLRCTAKQAMSDSYWCAGAAGVVPEKLGHKKSASTAVPSTSPIHLHSLSTSFVSPPAKDTSTPRDPSIPKDTSVSRLLDISLPWASNSRSTSRSSASRSVSRTPEKEKKNPCIVEKNHIRSKSQPKLRSPHPHVDGNRGRKLSTVQGSPLVNNTKKLGPAPLSPAESIGDNTSGSPGLFSLDSPSWVRKPVGPRMPTNIALREKEGARKRGAGAGKENTSRAKENSSVTDSKENTPLTKENSAPKMSGRKPRSRSRVGVLADLTGFAKNMDLSAHGVPRSRGKGTLRSASDLRNISRTDIRSASRADLRNVSKTDVRDSSRTDLDLGQNTSRASLNNHSTPNTSTADLMNASTAVNVSGAANTTSSTIGKGSVRDRMREWERERERLREMERLTEMQREAESILTSTHEEGSDDETEMSDEEVECAIKKDEVQDARCRPVASDQASPVEVYLKNEVKVVEEEVDRDSDAEIDPNITSYRADLSEEHIEIARIGVRASARLLSTGPGSTSVLGMVRSNSASTSPVESSLPSERRTSESGFVGLKHSVKASIDKGVRLYKSSTLGQIRSGRTTPVWCASPEPIEFEERHSGEAGRFSYEEIRPEGSAEKKHETDMDRMNLWIQNVERVVEETRQNFAFASRSITPPPMLPLSPPISRSNSQVHGLNVSRSSSRLPRRMLAANEIFYNDPDAPLSPGRSALADQSNSFSGYISPNDSGFPQPAILPTINVLAQTPRRRRRATISTRSPKVDENDMDTLASPSKRREKSRSQGNLDRHIRPMDKLEFDLAREPTAPTPRLSAVLDRNLFIAPSISPRSSDVDGMQTPDPIRRRSILFDDGDLTASPFHVEPYPPRKLGEPVVVLNSPDRRRMEGVYDRFLMSTTGVKRVGKGYQSDNLHNIASTLECKPTNSNPRNFKVFNSTRRVMPPPVSSDDQWRSPSVDELGLMSCGAGASRTSKEDSKNTATTTLVRRAIKAMVPGRTVSRRLSRTIVG
ncbi:hypothetical protein AZE42_04622 [Rhizopogon vesiculosus]|uniref:Protein kinase domain-containing protein n=1 Tax=Rhizopogon vesiculosus TaxID=180088 RepID=A0A1J8QJW4_9AGAM|nr:hypothetical protein AZE42_04622 [Rhizopogon vesiculosus]